MILWTSGGFHYQENDEKSDNKLNFDASDKASCSAYNEIMIKVQNNILNNVLNQRFPCHKFYQ